MSILIEINNGQPISLMWYTFVLLFFRILALENYCQNIDDWTQARLSIQLQQFTVGDNFKTVTNMAWFKTVFICHLLQVFMFSAWNIFDFKQKSSQDRNIETHG